MEEAKKEEIFRGRSITLHQFLLVAASAAVWILNPINHNLFYTQLSHHSDTTESFIHPFHGLQMRAFDVGCAIGTILSATADLRWILLSFGRKRALLLSLLLPVLGTILLELLSSTTAFNLGLLLNGIGYTSSMAISATLAVESSPRRLLPLIIFSLSLSSLDHYVFAFPYILTHSRAVGLFTVIAYLSIMLVVYRFVDESLVFLIAEGDASRVQEWKLRAKIDQNDDTLQLDQYDANDEEVDVEQQEEAEQQQRQPSPLIRTLKSISLHSFITALLISLVAILSVLIFRHLYRYAGFDSHHNYSIGAEFFFNEMPAILIASCLSYKIDMLNGLLASALVFLPIYAFFGLVINFTCLWYLLRILNNSSLLLLPYIALNAFNLGHKTLFVHVVLAVKMFTDMLTEAKNVGETEHIFDPFLPIYILVLIAILLGLKKLRIE